MDNTLNFFDFPTAMSVLHKKDAPMTIAKMSFEDFRKRVSKHGIDLKAHEVSVKRIYEDAAALNSDDEYETAIDYCVTTCKMRTKASTRKFVPIHMSKRANTEIEGRRSGRDTLHFGDATKREID